MPMVNTTFLYKPIKKQKPITKKAKKKATTKRAKKKTIKKQ
jgi:hypothetical protein